jgi:hypothetical protein
VLGRQGHEPAVHGMRVADFPPTSLNTRWTFRPTTAPPITLRLPLRMPRHVARGAHAAERERLVVPSRGAASRGVVLACQDQRFSPQTPTRRSSGCGCQRNLTELRRDSPASRSRLSTMRDGTFWTQAVAEGSTSS